MYLLDTNICIFLLNQRAGFTRILQRMDGLDRGSVLISAVSAAELQFGAWASQRIDDNLLRLERFLAEFDVIRFDNDAARAYGQVRGALKSAGTPIGPSGTLIAGHAMALGATLVTNNVREFQRVPDLEIEDWSA